MEVTGIRYGYHGMIHNDFVELKANSVSNILARGAGWLLRISKQLK